MKSTTLLILASGVLALILLATWNPVAGQDKEAPNLEEKIEKLQAAIIRIHEKHEEEVTALTKQLEKLDKDFRRHSHPVKMLNGKSGEVTSWKGGIYFIAYPKVGTGTSDADAAKTGGTWGTP